MTERIRKSGEAIYREGSMIQVSEFNDWGWYYLNKDEALELKSLVFKIKKVRKYKKDIFNVLGYIWQVEIVDFETEDSKISADNINITIDYVNPKNGLPYSFTLLIGIGDKTIQASFDQEVNRISVRHYWEEKAVKHETGIRWERLQLVKESGYYNSLLFFMIGATTTGKTCWVNALSNAETNIKAVRRYHELSGKELIYNGDPLTITEPIKPTEVEKTTFKDFDVKDKKGGILNVFLVDVSGEINNLQTTDGTTNIRMNLQNAIKRYASGVFVVRNEKWLFGEERVNENDPFQMIHRRLKTGEDALKDEEFCYILTGADRIKKTIEQDLQISKKFDLAPNSLIFQQTTSTKEAMEDHEAIVSYLIKKKEPNNSSPCFAVSCCSDTEDGKLDFSAGYNVELPFVYMLNFYTR
ncbi:hypothetical protein J5690_00640 [bacterium]|nr:hypothetical protein [bacterium]